MLVSHVKRFIYLKTVKTAGTSIEAYFERHCVQPGRWTGEQHARPAAVTEWGIIGSRGPQHRHPVWRNHMPARRVRELVGDAVWCSYFKFCAIRNPFDKVVSHFWFSQPDAARAALHVAPFDAVRSAFWSWLPSARLPLDHEVYCIDGSPAVDAFVRYERLGVDLSRVCAQLTIPWDPAGLGRYKSEYRLRPEPFWDYYDQAAERHVHDRFRQDIDRFGYVNGDAP